MLRLLLCLSALGLVSDAAPVTVPGSAIIDISACPITFFGKQFSKINVVLTFGKIKVHFDGFNSYVELPTAANPSFKYDFLDNATITSITEIFNRRNESFKDPALCGLKLTFSINAGSMDVNILNFGHVTGVYYSGKAESGDIFNICHNGDRISKLQLEAFETGNFDHVLSFSGCLDNTTGTTYLSGDSETDPAACTRATCQPTGVMDPPESTCSSSEVCLGNNQCGGGSFCSIVGPSVVDFNGATGAVPDFCIYNILSSKNHLHVEGSFRARRLTDLPFLDVVFTSTPSGGKIGITRRGSVDVDGDDITSSLSSTASRHAGVDISKDDSGITVTYTDTNLTRITLFFDGTLLHVTQEVPTGSLAYDQGLCADVTADSKLLNTSGCDVLLFDAAGENIDCSAVQTRCSGLLATLSSAVDRSAFVTACADHLLCHYPDVDGLACHFLDAYARTSRLSVPREASGCVPGSADIDISACPITFFGKQFSNISVNTSGKIRVNFDGFNSYVELPRAANPSFKYDFLDNATITSITEIFNRRNESFKDPALCGLKLTFSINAGSMDVHILNFGHVTGVYYSGKAKFGDIFNIGHNGDRISKLQLAIFKTAIYDHVLSFTGCLDNTTGTTYLSGDSETDPAACTRATCQPTGVMDPPESTCSSSEVCLGNNQCGERSFCSIVGPSVVDFNGVTGAVPDFCIYNILSSKNHLHVEGSFRERRLTDMPFLDAVFTRTTPSGKKIGITPGGRVDVDGDDITSSLSSTGEISKDDSGVTVTYTGTNLTRITLVFDGTLLHVTQEVPTGSLAYDQGLCADVTADSKLLNTSGCDVVTVDAAGENMDCSAVQTRCSGLLATLSSAVDRSAFVTACADNLLCHYPDVDGLACHFLDAYARTSRLSVPREASGCAVPVCVDHFCTRHEFCAVKDSGDAACFCRSRDPALKNYTEMHQYGDVATCSGDSASLTIYNCFLEQAGFDHSELHLNDSSCTGSYDADQHLVTFGFNSSHPCGGTLQQHGDQIVFANQVRSSGNSIITFKKQISMDFSCAYNQPSTPSTASFRIRDGSVSLTYNTENLNFTLDMGLFTDAAFSSSSMVTESTELELNQKVFVRLDAPDLKADTLALVIEDCWTTAEATPTGAYRYDLISNKCPSDQSVTVPSNGEALVSFFQFNVFEYADASTPDIFLHCQVSLCIVANGCVPTCSEPHAL